MLKAWGDAIVEIGATMRQNGNYQKKAGEVIDTLYAFDIHPVLFKPTKASQQRFRLTREGALSYFVGGNSKYPEDYGFAINPWTKVQIFPSGIFVNPDTATAMGSYKFTDLSGKETEAEFTFQYLPGTK